MPNYIFKTLAPLLIIKWELNVFNFFFLMNTIFLFRLLMGKTTVSEAENQLLSSYEDMEDHEIGNYVEITKSINA